MGRISPLYDGILLNCSIVSDVHIDIKNPLQWFPKLCLKKALKDAEKSETPVDAFISVGDTTSRGSDINWFMTKNCFEKYHPSEKILLALGNHDTWSDEGYDKALERYFENTEKICGVRRELPYFAERINGFTLIFLGSDSASGCAAAFSDDQIAWFEDEMKRAALTGKPVFVFNHQSINEKHGLPKTWDKKERPDRDKKEGGIGLASDKIESILKKHDNVFYFSGHSHMGLSGERSLRENGYASFEKEDGLNLINLPSLTCPNHHGDIIKPGIGFQLEVYGDKVVIRPRDFFLRKWVEKVEIRNGKPFLEE